MRVSTSLSSSWSADGAHRQSGATSSRQRWRSSPSSSKACLECRGFYTLLAGQAALFLQRFLAFEDAAQVPPPLDGRPRRLALVAWIAARAWATRSTGASGDARASLTLPSRMRATPPSPSGARSASLAHALARAAARAGGRSPRPPHLLRPLSRPPRGTRPPPSLAQASTLPGGGTRPAAGSPTYQTFPVAGFPDSRVEKGSASSRALTCASGWPMAGFPRNAKASGRPPAHDATPQLAPCIPGAASLAQGQRPPYVL